uniref:Reverse transcriptase zinc-binding domain-containing protein n=1 Tax=Medicago truncatula TaxID=3880 RepID=A2Q3X5_MEDTR|nr:hypothetical protein MtrDRAFT_AC155890g41v2 [Medicago truncatula]
MLFVSRKSKLSEWKCKNLSLGGRLILLKSVLSFIPVGMADRWVWKLHHSNKYILQSTYSYLTAVDTNITEDFHHFLWHKAVPLKVNIFVWRLFLNRLATKDNLRKKIFWMFHWYLVRLHVGL